MGVDYPTRKLDINAQTPTLQGVVRFEGFIYRVYRCVLSRERINLNA